MSRQGGLRTRPYPDPTIRHSQFAIRRCCPFATRRFYDSPLATRYSPSFPFAIRRFFRSPLAARCSPSFPFAIRYSRFFDSPFALFPS
jgi:hypothetical protein